MSIFSKESRERAQQEIDQLDQQRIDAKYSLPGSAAGAATVEYHVDALRESLIGGKFSAEGLGKLLNARARQGWSLKQIAEADVKGRLGPGGVDGLLAIFERPLVQEPTAR